MFRHHKLRQFQYQHVDFALPGAAAHYPADVELESTYLDISLCVDIERRTAAGTVTHTVRSARPGPVKLEIHAVDFEQLVVEDPDGKEIAWHYDGSKITVTWQQAFARHEARKLAIQYHVERPVSGLYFSSPSSEYPDDGAWAATDHETERARHWLPVIDLPNIRPTLRLQLKARSQHMILANGKLVGEEDHNDGWKTARWELNQPCPSYLVCFAIGDFTRCDDGEFQGAPIAYFSTREFGEEDLKRSFGRTGEMLAWMTEKLGSGFPYPKYYQIALPGIGGAMENISLVTWDDLFVMDEVLAKELKWLVDQINLHEMAHSWFGDHIVCRDFSHAWLKESWAVYMETCWLEDSKGAEERDYDFFQNLEAYLNEADNRYMRPIMTRKFDHSWRMYDRHLYPGGAVRLHMLHRELGDEVFWMAVRDYVQRFGGAMVETSDFRKVLEEHSGRSLGKWFDQWIASTGYPDLKVNFEYDNQKQEGTFQIEQKQEDEDKGVGLFDLVTDLGWVINGQLHTREVRIQRDKHEFIVSMESEPEQVRIDPKVRTVCKIRFNPGNKMLRRQLTDASDVYGRILAARELCKTGKRKNIQAVGEAYKKESFWGCRQRFAEALGNAGCGEAVECLAELLGWETDPMVCVHLVRAAGQYRDPAIRDALKRFLDSGPNLYFARSAAWEALGVQRDQAPFDEILEAASNGSPLGWEQQGALKALAGTRDRKALQPLLDSTIYGATSGRTRSAAVAALGQFAKQAETPDRGKAIERLIDLLRDPSWRVRKAAAEALKSAGATEAASELEAYQRRQSEQEATDIRRLLADLRSQAQAATGDMTKQLEEFRDQLRKLSDRLSKVEARTEQE